MSKFTASILLISTLLFAAAPVRAQPETGARVCPGLSVARFEQRFPQPVERFAIEHAMLDPFVELWQCGPAPRPAGPTGARHRLRTAGQAVADRLSVRRLRDRRS